MCAYVHALLKCIIRVEEDVKTRGLHARIQGGPTKLNWTNSDNVFFFLWRTDDGPTLNAGRIAL